MPLAMGSRRAAVWRRCRDCCFSLWPLFALILKVLYRRTRRLYLEHLIFALHFHTFAFLVLTVEVLRNAPAQAVVASRNFGPANLLLVLADGVLQLSVFVYLFLAMRRVYGQRRLLTGAKMLLLLVGYLIIGIAAGALLINAMRLRALWM